MVGAGEAAGAHRAVSPPKPELGRLLSDLMEEQDELRRLLEGASAEAWARSTTPGWSVRDQIAHLAYFDDTAVLSMRDPQGFAEMRGRALADVTAFDHEHLLSLPPDGVTVLSAWTRAAERFRAAAAEADPAARVAWFGPDMSLLSLISARLMETWAHGQDVADALQVARRPTDRLSHVVGLAVRARAEGYVVRGLAVPGTPIRVEVTAPSGRRWGFGPEDADERIDGSAEDFCLTLTRRRHVDDTSLTCEGHLAREWMEIGQAYAGPPGAGPARRQDDPTEVR